MKLKYAHFRKGIVLAIVVALAMVVGLSYPKQAADEKIGGGILPHHLIVREQFDRFFEFLEGQNPEVVVVIGPNHRNIGKGSILTTKKGFISENGALESAISIIDKLTESGLAEVDDYPFAEEHSIISEVEFIKRTFPKASIVPIILKSDVTEEDADRLGIMLSKILPKESLVLGSVDFSHYQPDIVSDFHDKTSLFTIKNFDFEHVYDLEIDSPASVFTVLSYLREVGAEKMVYQKRTSAAAHVEAPELTDNTSHLFLAFAEGEVKPEFGVSFLFFGDTIFDRYVEDSIKNNEPDYLFAELHGLENRFFRGNHFNILNLEGPITTQAESRDKMVVFNNNQEQTLAHLKQGEFNLVNLANNHIEDFFKEGAQETISVLESAGVGTFGYSEPCKTQNISGFKVAFCGFVDDGIMSHADMLKTVEQGSREADKTVVSMHWGYEMIPEANDSQVELAHQLIDGGADVIIGHHPHVIQPFEIYKNKPIIYSLGNFIFDQQEGSTKHGLGIGVFLEADKTTLYFYPFKSENFQPKLLDYQGRQEFFKEYLKDYPLKGVIEGKMEILQ